jgi:hypothetical protein
MAENVKIDESFLEPLESMLLELELARTPLVFVRANDHTTFVSQIVAALGGTVVYTSQFDFVQQMLVNMTEADHLFAVIDEPLPPKAYKLIRSYLAARDVVGADLSALANEFNAGAPHPQHRLILVVDGEVFGRHGSHEQQELATLCTVIGVP